ncbi:unnamed protein product [Diamesa serratosioi]
MYLIGLIISLLICAVFGDHEGYPSKGWKPDGPQLQFPTKYGPPSNIIEIATEINNNYDSTTAKAADDFLKVQELPRLNSYSEFSKYQRNNQQPYLLSPSFAPTFRMLNKEIVKNVGQSYGLPPLDDTPQLYGTNNEERKEFDESSRENSEDKSVIALANANNQENILQSSKNGDVGQYYILLPDNSLQKVKYSTVQTEEDRQNNIFSAQLKYYPVEAIKDPVYGHDSQGKLTRLLK